MYEINLVPDIKAEAIKAQKTRNFVFFVAGTVSAIAIGLVVVLVGIRAGQDIRIASQDSMLKTMTQKLESYDGLDEILTVQTQLNHLETIKDNKKVLSRVFTILSSMMPSGTDTISISSLDVNLNESTMTFDGQANAGAGTDGIDYRVLEAFKKQVGSMKYDYGRYVDANGEPIPTMCIVETDNSGVPLTDADGNVYAQWTRGVKGCDPSSAGYAENTVDEEALQQAVSAATTDSSAVTRIYRTPKFEEWHSQGYMKEDGEISGIEHFASSCNNYTLVATSSGKMKPVTTNDCLLAPDGVVVTNSSNGRESGGGLVLRFTATIYLNEEVFKFNNKHLIAIAPSGGINVTDSFVQIGNMFSERAMDCEEGDTSCRS